MTEVPDQHLSQEQAGQRSAGQLSVIAVGASFIQFAATLLGLTAVFTVLPHRYIEVVLRLFDSPGAAFSRRRQYAGAGQQQRSAEQHGTPFPS